MKREKLLSCLCGGGLAFCVGFGGVACMVTGLELAAALPVLAMGCALGAAVAAVCLYFKRGGIVYVGFSLLCLYSLILWGEFTDQAGNMAAHILDFYNRAYGVFIPEALMEMESDSHSQPLLAMGWIISFLCCRTVCRAKGAALTVLAAVLPLAACLVVTDTVPDTPWLYLLLFGLSLLLLTQILRRRAPAQAPKLTAMLALPLAAILMLLFLLVPRDSYTVPDVDEALAVIQDWFERIIPHVGQTSEGELVIRFDDELTNDVDLGALGSRRERETPVMEVTASYSGTLYLRGRNYASYDGKTWLASEDLNETFGLSDIWTRDSDTVTVRTYGTHKRLYLPYYPAGNRQLTDGMAENAAKTTRYTLDVDRLRDNWRATWQALFGASTITAPTEDFLDQALSGSISDSIFEPEASDEIYYGSIITSNVDPIYTDLPENTMERARALLVEQILLHGYLSTFPTTKAADTLEVVKLIEQYVSQSAEYDLNPGRMPAGEDFALWFLEESDKGYCVHFASAAVVLLRAAGIPARYVEGYTVQVEADETTVVREKMAHAWAEYYLEGLGWVILDPTPADTDDTPSTTAPTQRPTEPSESTTAPTEEPTKPSETAPSQTGPAAEPSEPRQEEPEEMPKWPLGILLWTAALAALIWGQWKLRRRYILATQRSGSSNARALARWRETVRLCRLLKQKPPEDLRALAEKAKFSQHAITAEELARFTVAQQELVRQMRSHRWYRRLLYRLIFAAY